MSKKGSNNLLIVAGIAAVGYYLYSKGYFSGASAPVAAAPAAAPLLTPTLTSTNLVSTVPATATAQPTTTADPRLAIITKWFDTLDAANRAQAYKILPAMTPDEVAGLYDIVNNDFYGNGITTDAQRAFWNAWRVKYHVNDGTYA